MLRSGSLPEFDLGRVRAAQERLARKVIEAPLRGPIRSVCGMDVAYTADQGVGAAVVMSFPDLELIEEKIIHRQALVPYISTFLAFREMPFLSSLMRALETRPDVLLINGHGIYHPAFFGLASHFGVVFGVASIGVANGPLRMPGEERRGDKIFYGGRRVASIAGGWRRGLYVSVGHGIDLDQASVIVGGCLKGHRMPEPLFLADHLSSRVARGK